MADRRLQVFHAVAKQMSFTRAAEVLFMTQPAVTFQIKQLEEYDNARLFERGHGKISLTPAGDVVLDYAERILALTAELETRLKEMTGRLSGPLLVGASTTAAECMLPPILGEFKAQFPEVQAKLFVANSGTIESRVAEYTLDVGLIEAPSRLPALLTEACCEDELIVIVSPRHGLAGHARVHGSVFPQGGHPSGGPEGGDGTGQSGGPEGCRGRRPRFCDHAAHRRGKGTQARRVGGDCPGAAPHADSVAGLPEGEIPLAAGEFVHRVRQGQTRPNGLLGLRQVRRA